MSAARAIGLTIATLALAPAAAGAGVLRAETVLPPGQSGFVSLTGVASGTSSPHLYDQIALFTDFKWKPALFGQPTAAPESPKAGVTVARDAYGVPTIRADNADDMWFGAGYAVAQDRLFQLDLFRHATTGTLAEIVGIRYLDDDRIVRRDYYTAAELDDLYAGLPPAVQARLKAYRDGINAWIAHVTTNPLDLPGEYPATATPLAPWTVRDSIAIMVYLVRTLPTNADPDGLELSNMRGVQLGGARALDALVPLRTRHSLTTVPAADARFASQPGRTPRQEAAARRRSVRFVRDLPYPTPAEAGALRPYAVPAPGPLQNQAFTPRLSGSYMLAVRRRSDGHAFLFNGPQLGFDAPEKVLELDLHAPGIDLRGMTAPGVPVIGSGFNGHLAFGLTTGASDTDDLYVEKLVPGQPESYYFKGRVRQMDCRTERINYDSPPSDLLAPRPLEAGYRNVRICRTVHGPVQARVGDVAYARRYSMWGRELDTVLGLMDINDARDVHQVDRAVRKMTANENFIAADDKGNIGYWHPGLFPLRPRGYDERLPYPGTGEAEWRGIRSRAHIPAIINPRQGWLANWNNLPAVGWTAGDGTARKRMDGAFFRVGWLMRLVRGFAREPSFEGLEALIQQAGTVAQQFPLATSRLRRARRNSKGDARVVLQTLLAWDGSYARTAADGTVDPGVATWKAFRAAAEKIALAPFGKAADYLAPDDAQAPLYGGYHHGAAYHYFDAGHGQSYALRTLKTKGYRAAAAAALAALKKRFGSGDPQRWREPRSMYPIGAVGATAPPSMPFFDRGTYEQLIELGRSRTFTSTGVA